MIIFVLLFVLCMCGLIGSCKYQANIKIAEQDKIDLANGVTKEMRESAKKNWKRTQELEIINRPIQQLKCPKCNSTNFTPIKQGFGVKKAAAGVILTGGIGLLAGGINANKIHMVCMNCGNTFNN